MTEPETPTAAFILSLIAGIIILLSGIMLLVMGTAFMSEMMGGYYLGMMGGYSGITGFISSMIAWIGVWGIICGAIILYGAYMLSSDPASHGMWGFIIIIISLASLFEGGGFLIGAILGILGGIFATIWEPVNNMTEAKK
jgi:hypothetical protein